MFFQIMVSLYILVVLPSLVLTINLDLHRDKRQTNGGDYVYPFGLNRRANRIGPARLANRLKYVCRVAKKLENAQLGRNMEKMFGGLADACKKYGPIKKQLIARLRKHICTKLTPYKPSSTSSPVKRSHLATKQNRIKSRHLVKALLEYLK
ncbi:hypothetical protein SNE40_011452 [Patella caerulea]|uniref:Uncharacterized protein n=1 Tax=Patella caerulea TaxID=87958 RepID=A0AAN8PU22_PATCE